MVARTRAVFGAGGLVLAIILDQWTKWWFVAHKTSVLTLVKNFLTFEFTRNTGLAFGLGGNRWVIIVVSVLLLGFLLWFAWAEWKNAHHLAAWASVLMGVGALSNLLDRIRYGYVVDWIDVHYWSIFNLADTWITLGAILIVVNYWRHDYGRSKISKAS